jgi:hypothetical protein
LGSNNLGQLLYGYFLRKLEDSRLVDIEPAKLTPTWRNKRIGEERITKRLDRFLFFEPWLDDHVIIR